MGIELNDEKRELARSKTRHLGFLVDLEHKRLAVTDKHRRRVVTYFDRFLLAVRKQGRIHIKSIQKILGLQIWISTVFRVARQFLTSTCDIIRVTGDAKQFYPKRHRALTKRAVFDISFWRRFVMGDPESSFSFFLDQLPVNDVTLSCDASGEWGMAGVMRFAEPHTRGGGIEGQFWQMPWHQWRGIRDFGDLRHGHVKICAAEFLAVLITLETFADHCSGRFTTIEIDNTVAKQWWDSSRCPISPFDRCAQGLHLYLLQRSIKIRTEWVSSSANCVADACSRKNLSRRATGHHIAGVRMKKSRPKFTNVLRFI